jgi:hypothetical protein
MLSITTCCFPSFLRLRVSQQGLERVAPVLAVTPSIASLGLTGSNRKRINDSGREAEPGCPRIFSLSRRQNEQMECKSINLLLISVSYVVV